MVQSLLSPCLAATTFGGLSDCLRTAVGKMQRLDAFKNVNVLLDRIKEDPAGHDVKVVLDVEEKRFRLHAGTEAKRNDLALNFSGQLYNVFGRAEQLDVSASIGQHTTAPLNLSFSKPINGDPDKLLNFSLGSFSSAFPSGAKYCHSSNHASAAYQVAGLLPNSRHDFQYGVDWRTVYGIAPDSSPSIRRSAGHSLKSALSHTWIVDNRDDQVFPTSGHFWRLSQELAGGPVLGGDAKHFMQDLFASIHTALPALPNVILSCSMHAGHLMTIGGTKSFILDRFKLGGPNSVRGFALNSIGPKDRNDPLGGDLAFEAGASLSFPLVPSLSHILRAQLFTNFGILGQSLKEPLAIRQRMQVFMEKNKPHLSVGAGLLFKMGPSTRLELNVSMPLRPADASVSSPSGIQLGLGIDFL